MDRMVFGRSKIFGKRVVKTALAAALSMYISELVFGQAMGFSGYSAIVAMTTSLPETLNISLKRMLATFLAAVFAVFFYLTEMVNPFTIFIGIILIISICNYFRWQGAIELATIFFIAMITFVGPKSGMMEYVFIRLTDTAIGLIVGLLVNLVIAKPRMENFLYRAYLNLYNHILIEFKNVMEGRAVKSEDLLLSIGEIIRLYDLFKRERKLKFSKRNDRFTPSKINDEMARITTNVIDLSHYENIPLTDRNKKRLQNEYNIHNFYEENEEIHGDEIIFFNYELNKVMDSIDTLSEDLIIMKKELRNYDGIIEETIEDIEKEENVKIGEFEKTEDEDNTNEN